jgi:hypothetical protein
MALGVSLILVGLFGLMGLVLWFAAIGLQLAGWWLGRARPPGKRARRFRPSPGQDVGPPPSGAPSGTVEERPRGRRASLPENG